MGSWKQTAFRLPAEQLEALQRIKDRDGIPMSVQVRRAIDAWIEGRDRDAKKGARRKKTR